MKLKGLLSARRAHVSGHTVMPQGCPVHCRPNTRSAAPLHVRACICTPRISDWPRSCSNPGVSADPHASVLAVPGGLLRGRCRGAAEKNASCSASENVAGMHDCAVVCACCAASTVWQSSRTSAVVRSPQCSAILVHDRVLRRGGRSIVRPLLVDTRCAASNSGG